MTMASSSSASIAKPADGIDFSSLPWNLNLPDKHVYLHMTTESDWSAIESSLDNNGASTDPLDQYVFSYADKKLPVSPATTSLNYGTTIWEGLKAYRATENEAIVFRCDQNYQRMKRGAEQVCLPMPNERLFLRAIQLAVQKNAHLLPPVGEGMKLYIRPMLLGSGQQLGLYPSPQFSFLVYVSPTGNYFKSATT